MYSAHKLNNQGENIYLDVLFSQFRTSLLFHLLGIAKKLRNETQFIKLITDRFRI